MASLLCHYCHSRITENGMSNGVQHYMFPFSTWELYSKTDKPIVLYLTEGPENFFTIWKCLECGCFHLMPGYKALVLRSYFPTEPPVHPIVTDEPQYLIFDDYRGPLKTPLAREEKKVIMTSSYWARLSTVEVVAVDSWIYKESNDEYDSTRLF